MRILMLGNSFTYYHNMPLMLAALMEADVTQHTRAGAHLSEHLDPETELGARTLAALRDERWDYVVLQEYSTGPITAPEQFYDSVRRLCALIRENGAKPVLYATWAFKRDGAKLKSSGLAYVAMARDLYDAYHQAGEENDAPVADVGQAFFSVAGQRDLYAEDDYHPSWEGSLLAAKIIMYKIQDIEAGRL